MKITYINHAGFIIEYEGIKIFCDPWIEGRVFNNAWSLISKTLFDYTDFSQINYIWFSHEHPDHFYPPNLLKIPSEIRKNISILYQFTEDKRLVNFCKELGFKNIIELPKGIPIEVAKDFFLLCEHYKDGDSWIYIKTPTTTLLNLNDCEINSSHIANEILKKTGNPDILMSQFSYAYWGGNKENIRYRQKVAEDKLKLLQWQCNYFLPKFIIPIASYIYFCHEENFYMNDSINTIEKTYSYLKEAVRASPVILYKNESFTIHTMHNSKKSIQLHAKDLAESLINPVLSKSSFINENIVNKEIVLFNALVKQYPWYVKLFLRAPIIYISDYKSARKLNLTNGLIPVKCQKNESDIIISSESLYFCLKFPYGLETLLIGSRLQIPSHGHYSRFYNLFRFELAQYQGYKLNVKYFIKLAINKIKKGVFKGSTKNYNLCPSLREGLRERRQKKSIFGTALK